MRRAAIAAVAVAFALAGCGGGGNDEAPEQKLRKDVKEKADKVRERVERAGGKADVVDKALLEIEQSDLPDDVKKELLEAKELLDRYPEE
jgi:DUF917 family protein